MTLEFSYLENPMDRGAWWATTVYEVIVRYAGPGPPSLKVAVVWQGLFSARTLATRRVCPPPDPHARRVSGLNSYWRVAGLS